MAVFVFDLDDTLYPELSYVHSGFRAVAAWLAARHPLNADVVAAELMAEEAAHGRGQVFDAVLRQHGLFSRALVAACVRTYRHHQPTGLVLYPDAERALQRLHAADRPLYLVTDGHKEVQARKVAALGLASFSFQHLYLTNRYGRHRAKPSPYCFELICRRERTTPAQVVYVGDNLRKDFVGIKPLGFQTVRVLRGNYAHLPADAAHEASRLIQSLDEL